MSEPLNQAVVKLWDHGHQVAVQVQARVRCDEHGEHQIADTFVIPPNYVMAADGLWLPYVLGAVGDRFQVVR